MPLSSSCHDVDDEARRRGGKAAASHATPRHQSARSATPRASPGKVTPRSTTATQPRLASPAPVAACTSTTTTTSAPIPAKAVAAAPTAGPSPRQDGAGTVEVAVATLTSAALAQTGLRHERQAPLLAPLSKSPAASRPRTGSRDGGSLDATTRRSHRGVTPRSAVPSAAASLPTRALSKAPWLVGERRLKAAPSRAALSESRSVSRSPGNAMSAVATTTPVLRPASSGAAGAPSSSSAAPRVSHPRPLLSSKEADYLNFAHQRGFMGRFRCAAPVVVRTPPTATSHTPATERPRRGSAAEEAGGNQEHSEVGSGAAPTPAEAPAAAATHGSHTQHETPAADPETTQPPPPQVQEQERDHEQSSEPAAAAAAAGHPGHLSGTLHTPRRKAERRVSSSGASAVSGGTLGRRRSSTSLLNGLGARSAASAPAAADSKLKSALVPSGGVPAANVAPLVQSGLHTSLWLAVQDGGLEVRSMANPNHVLATLPRRDARAVVTSLVEVCGNRVVAGHTDGTLHVYDAATMAAVAHVPAHTGAVTCLLYVRGAPRLHAASGSHANHGDAAGPVVATPPTHSLLVSGSLDRTLGVWEAAAMTPLHRLKGSLRSTCALAATMTGGYVVSGTDDGTLRLWDVVHGTQLTVTNDERAHLAGVGAGNSGGSGAQLESSPLRGRLPQPLAVSTAVSTPVAGPAESMSNTTAPRANATPAPHPIARPLALSMAASSASATAPPGLGPAPVPLPASQPSGSRRRSLDMLNLGPHGAAAQQHQHQHQQRRGGGPKSAPLIVRGTQQLAKPGSCPSSRLSSVPQPGTSSGWSAQDELYFAPLEADASGTLFAQGSLLVGPGGGISPVRRRSRADHHQSEDSSSSDDDATSEGTSSSGGEDGRSATERTTSAATPRIAAAPGPRTPRSLRRAIKKRAKGLDGSLTTTADAPSPKTRKPKGASGKRKKVSSKSTKKSVPPAPAPLQAALPSSKSATATATAAAAETPPERRRWSLSSLEHRLELWLHHYQRRVLATAAAARVMQRLQSGYDAVRAVNWPIECAHTDYVAALALVEDRLLVSASRDATAKVFALPSGQYVRTLSSSRRMPLSAVLYDAGLGRLYTAFSDGGVAAYDMLNVELPLLTLVQSPQTILSSTFVSLTVGPMHRFVVATSATADASPPPVGASATATAEAMPLVLGVTQYDRTTMAHGPNQTVTSYRVGQPSLRELNAAVSLAPLQQHRASDLAELAARAVKGSLEERELAALRCYGRVLERSHARRRAQAVFSRWRRWAQRRAQLPRCVAAVNTQAHDCTAALAGRYLRRWRVWAQQRTGAAAHALLRDVQLRASDAPLLDVAAEVRAGQRHGWGGAADAMAGWQRARLRAEAYGRWRAFLRQRQARLRQCTAYNRLLLSTNASSYTPACRTLTELTRVSVRRANRVAALQLVAQRTERSTTEAHRRRAFDVWRAWAGQQARRPWSSGAGAGWSAVEPLSATLVQPHLLRHRCFARWRAFALYVARTEQLAHERDTLQMEYAAIEKALATPASVAALTVAVQTATKATAATEAESKELQARLDAVSHEVATLRTKSALHMLIAGYRVPSVVQPASAAAATTAAMTSAELWSAASLRRGSRASTSSGTTLSNSVGGRGHVPPAHCAVPSNITDASVDEEELQRRREEDALLFEASAVLRALKGNAVQCARDDRLLAAAHALAVRLPIHEPLPNAGTSVGGGGSSSSRHGPASASAGSPGGSRRQAGWSVSNAKSGGSTPATAAMVGLSATSPQSSPRRRPATATPSAGGAQAGSPNAGQSAAQMWAAQPAEETYANLADAFNAIFANLVDLLHAASLECGAASLTSRGVGQAGVGGDADAIPVSWLAQVPLKQRRVMMGEVLKLVTLFDSFAAHNDLPVECAGSISTRGTANTRALPLCSLCSPETASALLEQASVLLELVDPQLWPRQLQLNHLQDAYAAAIAQLNATVSSAGFSDTLPHAATTMTMNSTGSGDQVASPAPAALVMKPPALCLSAEVLQEAGAAMLSRDVAAATATAGGGTSTGASNGGVGTGSRSTGRQPNRSVSSVQSSGPTGGADIFTALGPCHSGGNGHGRTYSHGGDRVHGADEGLNITVRSLEDERATPTPELVHPRSMSFSHRTFSVVSTPRSYTSRTATSSVGGTTSTAAVVKAYLGFRVNVVRDPQTLRRATISIREVVPQYVNADGEELDSPAQAAGLQVGDQLVRFAGYTVTDLAAFNAVVARHANIGAELPLVVLRGGEQLSKTITVGSRAATGM